MKRKKVTRRFCSLSAIVLVLSLILSPVQALAVTDASEEQDQTQLEAANAEELGTGQAEEAAEIVTTDENESTTDEVADAVESEEQTAGEKEDAEVSEEVDSTEAELQQEETAQDSVVEEEELLEETEESLEDSEFTTLNQSEEEESELEVFEDSVTTDSISVSWTSSGIQDVEEYEIYLGYDLVDTVSAETTSYTFEGLTLGEEYTIYIIAIAEDDYVYSNYLYSTPTWTDEELVPVSIHTKVNADFHEEVLLIRGNDDSTESFEELYQLFWADGELEISLPVGSYEAVLYNELDPSISTTTTFEVEDGIDYATNPIQLDFDLDQLREEAEPFEFEIIDVDETSFTIKWSDVTKLLSISLNGSGSDLGETREYLEEILLDPDATEYTVTDLTPNLLYNIYLNLQYVYDLESFKSVKVKTNGEDADAPEVVFGSDSLNQAVSEEVGVHTRDVTEKDMEYLKQLFASDSDIDSLQGLELAENLESLYVAENNISDLSPLENLQNLEQLYISFNQIRDLSPLENLTSLTSVNLNSNEISDLSPLSNLNLTTLRISNNDVQNIDVLENFDQLQILDVSGNPLTDYSVVEDLTTLIDLSMSNLEISDINFISNLKELNTLYLSNNNIEDISVLAGLDKLVNLSLAENNISDLTPLEGLTNLYSLNLEANNITDISSLANLNEIEHLYLSSNPIESVSVLAELPNLVRVYLYGIELSDDDYALLERLTEDGVFVYHEDFIDNRQGEEAPDEEDNDTGDEGTDDEDPGNDDDGTNDNDQGTDNGGTDGDDTGSNNEGSENDGAGTDDTDGDNGTSGNQDSAETDDSEEATGSDKTETSASSETDTDKKDNELPSTATNMYNLMLLGAIILAAGIISLYVTRKTKTSN